MSPGKTPTSARAIVDELFGRQMTREIWTGNYEKALPLTVQDFDLFAVLPAVFYMFRFGQRRGKGKFLETFGSEAVTAKERKQTATIERIATKLAATVGFVGFNGDAERAILGDLLLCFCLENAKRGLGRKEQVQRVAPTHYMASWVAMRIERCSRLAEASKIMFFYVHFIRGLHDVVNLVVVLQTGSKKKRQSVLTSF